MKLKWITGAFMALFSIFVVGALVGGIWLDKPKSVHTIGHTPPKPKTTTSVVTTTTTQTKSTSKTPMYKDGVFTGQLAINMYGPVQVQVIIAGGKIIDVAYLQMPTNSPVSQAIATNAEPVLTRETLQVQSAQIAIVSRATYDSHSYIQSLQSALNQAKIG